MTATARERTVIQYEHNHIVGQMNARPIKVALEGRHETVIMKHNPLPIIRLAIYVVIALLGPILYGPSIAAMPIPSEVKELVAFIYAPDDKMKLTPHGTAFFVGVKRPGSDDNWNTYIVTAKHVILNSDKSIRSQVYVRVNRKNGGVDTIRLDLVRDGRHKNVFLHTDETVDIAVLSGWPDPQTYQVRFIMDKDLIAKNDFKELGIAEGSDVFFTGLFTDHAGEQKNYPIVRFGRLALVTDEKVFWNGVKRDIYLMEASTYWGNSGSPVFFYLGTDRKPGMLNLGSPVIKLAGIVNGFFGRGVPLLEMETARAAGSIVNYGVTAVTPAYKLHEIIFGEELAQARGF